MASNDLSGPSLSGNINSLAVTNTFTSDATHSNAMKSIKPQRGGISESSTTSDNTTDFIEIVKKHDIVYNTHHPDYKNVEIKLKVWSQIAEEIGLSVDASKRKWKNLRDSYTKYLRSFRVGTKTSKKYQFWAHAEHMDFLKPYQGPGRSTTVPTTNTPSSKDDDDNECDLGYQVLSKATDNTVDESILKNNTNTNNNNKATKNPFMSVEDVAKLFDNIPSMIARNTANIGSTVTSVGGGLGVTTTTKPSLSGTIMLPMPSLPTVQLPPSLTAKPILQNIPSSSSLSSSSSSNISHSFTTAVSSLASLTSTSMPSQVFTLPQLSAKAPIPMPSSNTASSVGCLIIEPQLFASADTIRKEFNNSSSNPVYASSSSTAQITPSGLQIYPNVSSQVSGSTSQTLSNRLNPPLITKIRRVPPAPQPSAINLCISTTSSSQVSSALTSSQINGYSSLPSLGASTTITATNGSGGGSGGVPPPAKKPKTSDIDITSIIQANRNLDANTLFFLSLARSVRSMPTKFQSLAKMRCMRIVSDIELELDNANNESNGILSAKYCTNDNDSPPTAIGSNINERPKSEHFFYVMSPSRVEGMIDLSSDDEITAGIGN